MNLAGGGCLCPRGARARRDARPYEGDRGAQMMSTAMTVMAIAPLLGPIPAPANPGAGGLARDLLDARRRRVYDPRGATDAAHRAAARAAGLRARP